MFDILAIDWGSKRFGLSYGSTSTGLIISCEYECFTIEIWQILKKEITNKNPQKIIIGIPTTFDLRPTEVTIEIQKFADQFALEYPSLLIIMLNERQSTKIAKKTLQNPISKHHLNHQASSSILKFYLDSQR
jgi:putative transcription antitermination factor YqgF